MVDFFLLPFTEYPAPRCLLPKDKNHSGFCPKMGQNEKLLIYPKGKTVWKVLEKVKMLLPQSKFLY